MIKNPQFIGRGVVFGSVEYNLDRQYPINVSGRTIRNPTEAEEPATQAEREEPEEEEPETQKSSKRHRGAKAAAAPSAQAPADSTQRSESSGSQPRRAEAKPKASGNKSFVPPRSLQDMVKRLQ